MPKLIRYFLPALAVCYLSLPPCQPTRPARAKPLPPTRRLPVRSPLPSTIKADLTSTQGRSLGKVLPIVYDSCHISPDGAHTAYMAQQGDKWCMVIDGKPGPAITG